MEKLGEPATDLLFFYIGHGGFAERDRFFLSIRATNAIDPLGTSITRESLARMIREGAAGLRTYLVLDCCFAGAAVEGFLGGALDAAVLQLEQELPWQGDDSADINEGKLPAFGVALLCAAGPRDRARAPADLPDTIFTGSLLELLEKGECKAGEFLTLRDMYDILSIRLRARYSDSAAPPQLHQPNQRQGHLDRVPLFRNVAWAAARPPASDAPTRLPASPSDSNIPAELPRFVVNKVAFATVIPNLSDGAFF